MIATGQIISAQELLSQFDCFTNYHMSGNEGLIAYTSDSFGSFCQERGDKNLVFQGVGLPLQLRLVTSDWAAADRILSAALIGSYLYALLTDDNTTTARLYRYDKTNLAAGGTLMTVSGQSFGSSAGDFLMGADPSGNIYFTKQAGNSTSAHIISKYTISGTTITFVSNTTCGSTSGYFERFYGVDSSGNFYGCNYSTDNTMRKYNSSGTLVTTYVAFMFGGVSARFGDTLYVRNINTAGAGELYMKVNT